MKPRNREEEIQIQLAEYLTLAYPDVLFHSDVGSGVRLPIKLASRAKALNGGRRGWPDLFIAKKATATVRGKRGGLKQMFYGGLFIELKAEGIKLKKKDGTWAREHFAEQAAVLEELRKAGYRAEFAVGFAEAKQIIDDYLGDKQ